MMRSIHRPTPFGLLVVAALGFALLAIPFLGLAQRTPWSSFAQIATEETVLRSISLSMIIATSSACICVILGIPLGLVLAKAKFKGLKIVRAIVLLPMVLQLLVEQRYYLHWEEKVS